MIRTTWSAMLAILIVAIAQVPSAQPAEMSTWPSGVIEISGEIEKGDAQIFEHGLLATGLNAYQNRLNALKVPGVPPVPLPAGFNDKQKYIGLVQLNSPGGNLVEALRIGHLVRQLGLATRVQKNHQCTSACAIIWTAGVLRIGTTGHHKPYRPKLTVSDYAHGYLQSGSTISDAVRGYYRRMGMPQTVINRIERTPSDKMYWINGASKLGSELTYEPKFRELVSAQCSRKSGEQFSCALDLQRKVTDAIQGDAMVAHVRDGPDSDGLEHWLAYVNRRR